MAQILKQDKILSFVKYPELFLYLRRYESCCLFLGSPQNITPIKFEVGCIEDVYSDTISLVIFSRFADEDLIFASSFVLSAVLAYLNLPYSSSTQIFLAEPGMMDDTSLTQFMLSASGILKESNLIITTHPQLKLILENLKSQCNVIDFSSFYRNTLNKIFAQSVAPKEVTIIGLSPSLLNSIPDEVIIKGFIVDKYGFIEEMKAGELKKLASSTMENILSADFTPLNKMSWNEVLRNRAEVVISAHPGFHLNNQDSKFLEGAKVIELVPFSVTSIAKPYEKFLIHPSWLGVMNWLIDNFELENSEIKKLLNRDFLTFEEHSFFLKELSTALENRILTLFKKGGILR